VVILVTGPMAAGKSTVARMLASGFPRGVYLDGDSFRRAVAAGREEMTPEPSAEALRQLRTRYRVAAAAADLYVDAGFTVVVEDVVAGRDLEAMTTLIRTRPLHVVVLLPSRQTIAAREAGRAQVGYGAFTVDALYDEFEHRTPRIGTWLDTTEQSADETVAAILGQLPSGYAE
jgi:adenylylsulfate kinase-like enzyme